MLGLGPLELGILVVIILLLFGGGKIARLGGEMGSAVSNFRKELNQGSDDQAPGNTP